MPSQTSGDLLMEAKDSSIEFGRVLANPPPGEEIVITGLSGQYPDSRNVHEFRDNLFNKIDMVSDDSRRWEPNHPEIPQRGGKLFDIAKFDAGYFGFHHRQAHSADPMLRLLLETVVSAIFDAGLNPSDLEGTNTGVFVGVCFSESEKYWFVDKPEPQSFALTGCERSMMANRISYFLKLKGPSFVCDTACSSSLYAFENAYKALREGLCDQAIVGGANLCLHPFVSLQFARLGVLSADGRCKVFDKDGNGYARSEAISAILLQKAKDSNRIYATVLHAKTNCDGYKDSGITYPSGDAQIKLLQEFYQECEQVKPFELSFLEAHGTGTKVGDPEELKAMEDVFLPGRTTPLLIGSVKSNIGHSEPASGLCSITKAIIAAETGFIPPNLYYEVPRPECKSLEQGKFKVVTEKMSFRDNKGLIGINSFGFGGGNCHVLLRHHTKTKVNSNKVDSIPRLVCVSGRTEEAVSSLLDSVTENKVDVEYVRLLQNVFRKNILGHEYRGYSLLMNEKEISRSIDYVSPKVDKLVVFFSDVSNMFTRNIEELLAIFTVSDMVKRLQEIMAQNSINLSAILLNPQQRTLFEKILFNFVLQMILGDLLKTLGVLSKSTKVIGVNRGFSLGVLISAYFAENITLKECVESAIAIANAGKDINANFSSDLSSLILGSKTVVVNQLKEKLARILSQPKRNDKIRSESNGPQFSVDYLMKFLRDPTVPDDVRKHLVKDVAIYEVGNGDVLAMVKKLFNYNDKFLVSHGEDVRGFITSIGRLFDLGVNPQIHKIYPPVAFPVSRGTPMISPKVKWNHKSNWWVTSYEMENDLRMGVKSIKVGRSVSAFEYMVGHVIDGRNLFAATGYLYLVWETLASITGLLIEEMPIIFENCKFKRACTMPADNIKLELIVMIQRGSGNFEIIEGDVPVVTGTAKLEAKGTVMANIPFPTGVSEHVAPHIVSKDVYKELRLRGYNYKGKFRSIKSCDISAQTGKISWDGNWVCFIDNMLQLKILQEDTRMLYVPTGIERIIIDPKRHLEFAKKINEEHPDLPVIVSPTTGIIRCGGIEIKGLNASSIARRKYLATPVLEKYEFVPNVAKLTTGQAVRVNMQILLANLYSIKIKAVELVDDATPPGLSPLGELVHDVLADQPLIQPDIIILSKTELDVKNVKVEDKRLLTELDCSLVVGSQILQRSNILQLAFGSTKENGFILSREPLDFDVSPANHPSLSIVTVFETADEKLVFFKKKTEFVPPKVVNVSTKNRQFTWLPELQKAVETDGNVVVYAQNEPMNGILGLVACIRRELGGQNVRLVFLPENGPDFSANLPFYKEQLEKNLVENIYKNGQWGTYRHLLLEQVDALNVEHCYLNSLVRGDLSSLSWIGGPLTSNCSLDPEHTLVSVYYASLNFRDVMTASGRINVDAITRDRREQECVQGFEFSGRTQSGQRVFGMVTNGACSTLIEADTYMISPIPDAWTLEEAATIPVVYGTCFFALIKKGKMKRGDTVLIHSGTGGIGQAAIHLALYFGCTVYTTVGTQEKRDFLKKTYPQLTDKNIAYSRDTSFEKHIMAMTGGRGVDVVLNSLAEEKLLASVRCLAKGGRFVEIGKFDLASNNELNLLLISKDASFHGLMLDSLFKETPVVKHELLNFIFQGMEKGAIRPINRTIFGMNQAEAAFRYMGTGKHIGKVLIEIRKEEQEPIVEPSHLTFPGLPRYFCDSSKSYIICGGLGGFGLELADWLTLRGCRKLILTSRTGVRTGYQAYRISIWQSYGCTVQVATDDITTYDGCLNLITTANQLGPVHAIFNLAVVLKDSILSNQSEESFKVSFSPKAYATEYLDGISRKHCPELRDFVIFSSVSCGRGNAGQSNYGMANSVMERICEQRRSDGFPALAIEWGAIADVGLVAEMQNEAMEIEIGGTLQQRITSCLQVMDIFLKQKEAAVVSSIVVAEKKSGTGGADNIVDAVANILGVKDLKSVPHHATLAEVGMDSMTAVEIKQTLEREYEVFLTATDIKSMTFAKLVEIQAERDATAQNGIKKEPVLSGMDMILRYMGDGSTADIPVVPLEGKRTNTQPPSTILLLPGIEGLITILEPLYRNLEGDLVGLQFPTNNQKDSVEEMAATYLPTVEGKLSKSKPFNIIAYSFGGMVALELVALLEEKGYRGTLLLIDSSPDYLNSLATILEVDSDDKLQISLLIRMMSLRISYDIISKHVASLFKLNTFEERIDLCQQITAATTDQSTKIDQNDKYQRAMAICLYKRIKAIVKSGSDINLESRVILFKPTLVSIKLPEEDYGLSKYCNKPVEVRVFDGNHVSILDNVEVANAINELFGVSDKDVEGKGELLINVDKVHKEIPTKL
ncbi:fatty acid synthase [Dendroctonus ponderosae]|uniref:fatty acid synthase n=1 Tax=Dendroctonus ponderosae TaxID=77166 RepID=UPI0020357E69|nr:fatty acid synthase [Dendroctonus ponderosae]KAH1010150.1 hypothetical protein HUJ05_004495 [Dendroctonus ponderosae]